jgi:hypothetical protein
VKRRDQEDLQSVTAGNRIECGPAASQKWQGGRHGEAAVPGNDHLNVRRTHRRDKSASILSFQGHERRQPPTSTNMVNLAAHPDRSGRDGTAEFSQIGRSINIGSLRASGVRPKR